MLVQFAGIFQNREWRQLRGSLSLNYWLSVAGVSPYRFANDYLDDATANSKLIYKWMANKTWPTRNAALKVAGLGNPPARKRIPEALWFFDAFILFKNQPCPKRRVKALLESCCRQVEIHGKVKFQWQFPTSLNTITLVDEIHDTEALVQRKDFWGFFGIVALVRDAEARRDYRAHVARCKDMYRALPAAADVPWVTPSASLLRACADELRSRVLLSSATPLTEEELNAEAEWLK